MASEYSGETYDRPRPKRAPDLPETETEIREEGTDWERPRVLGRSDTGQASFWEVSIEEPLNIAVRLKKVYDPPPFPENDRPSKSLQCNVSSVEEARKLHEALGEALRAYDAVSGGVSDAK